VVAVTTDGAISRALIVNADDFGMSAGINRGIMEAVGAGVVTSASLMVGMPAFEDAVRSARMAGRAFGVGVHLTLTVGKPLARSASLVDPATGEFFPAVVQVRRALAGRIQAADVLEECTAQIARARAAGVAITHLDGHLHVHLWPGIAHVVRHVVWTERIPAVRAPHESLLGVPHWRRRVPQRVVIGLFAARARPRHWPAATTDHFAGHSLLGMRDFGRGVIDVLERLPPGTTELMVHPGYDDGPLPGNDRYRSQRENELRALTSATVRDTLRSRAIRLINFVSLCA